MKQQLEAIKLQALEAMEAAQTPAALDEQRVKWLGKKGELTAVLKMMGKLSAEERPIMGQLANTVRAEIEAKLEQLRKPAVWSWQSDSWMKAARWWPMRSHVRLGSAVTDNTYYIMYNMTSEAAS